MAVALARMTAAEFLATPEDGRTELIDGVVVVSEPTLPHASYQTRLIIRLGTWIESGPGRGRVSVPADVTMDDRNVFAPDVWWVTEANRPAPDQLLLVGVPDLVIEIRSPSTWARDRNIKLPRYEAVGVPEAWYVDTVARKVLVFRRSTPDALTFDVRLELAVDDTLTSPMLAGFSLPVSEIFAP